MEDENKLLLDLTLKVVMCSQMLFVQKTCTQQLGCKSENLKFTELQDFPWMLG